VISGVFFIGAVAAFKLKKDWGGINRSNGGASFVFFLKENS
jgi:hypothetical protein